MTHDADRIVQKLWNYCNVLRDDGLSYQDYTEQLTFLLFLKMADEQTKPPFNRQPIVPAGLDWPSLVVLDGFKLQAHYLKILVELGEQPGTLGVVFRDGQNKVRDPAKLRRLIVDLIGAENWMSLGVDVKGDAYEGLLAKNAEDLKSGAGQYFTPRVLISAIVEVMRPRPGQRICDPAAGTGGFLLAAFHHIVRHYSAEMDEDQKKFLRDDALQGWEIVLVTARLCLMNLMLHGITRADGDPPIHVEDALGRSIDDKFQMVLTNPPFGKKSSYTIIGEDGTEESDEDLAYLRDDFWATTKNKQLNFVQHVHSILDTYGTAAVVVPDNVLFEGGAGETIRRRLLKECDVHTLLRLPTGIFYRPGVKANVLFFDRKPGSEIPWTKTLWVYDLRTNQHFTLKRRPLRREDLSDFITCFNADNRLERTETERFRPYAYDRLIADQKASLDISWMQDESLQDNDNHLAPEIIAIDIVEELEAALTDFRAVAEMFGSYSSSSLPSSEST